MKLKNKILPLLLLASTAVGCTDGFETINSDPNKLYEVNLQSIFPGTGDGCSRRYLQSQLPV